MRRSGDVWPSWEKKVWGDMQMQGIACSRLHPEVRKLYTKNPIKLKSDVDFVCALGGKTTWFDAKCTKENVWNIREFVFRDTHVHQWAKLLSVKTLGERGGFLIWFYGLGKIVWCPVEAIELALKEGRASIHPESPLCTSQSDDTQIFFKKLIIGQ